jgi:hypothetical protein
VTKIVPICVPRFRLILNYQYSLVSSPLFHNIAPVSVEPLLLSLRGASPVKSGDPSSAAFEFSVFMDIFNASMVPIPGLRRKVNGRGTRLSHSF